MKRSEAAVTAERSPQFYFQVSAATLAISTNLGAVINAAITAGTIKFKPAEVGGYAVIQNNVASTSVRWRDDGVAPTVAVGMVLGNAELDYAGSVFDLSFIAASGSPILDISVYW